MWLEVFARGLIAQEHDGGKKRRYSPAYLQATAAVYFSTQFRATQQALVDRFTEFTNMPKTKWTEAAKADPKKAHVINTLEDFRVFLLSIQRVPANSLAFSARCRPPRRV